jgi:rhomboid-like protein
MRVFLSAMMNRSRRFSSFSSYPVRNRGIAKHVLFATGFTIFAFQMSAYYHVHVFVPEQFKKMKSKAHEKFKQLMKKSGLDDDVDRNGYTLISDERKSAINGLIKRISVAAGTDNWVVLGSIILANAGVFMLWRGNPRIQNYLMNNFRSSIEFRNLHQHVTSMFSHFTFGHLAFNMIGLWTFGIPMSMVMTPHYFLAYYLSAGVCASVMTRAAHMLTKTTAFSLGASHALYAVLSLYACAFPDHKISIIFLPMFEFDAMTGLKGIFLFDLCGFLVTVIKKRSPFGFDHAAHLMGLAFGIAYFYYGRHLKDKQLKLTFEEAEKRGKQN